MAALVEKIESPASQPVPLRVDSERTVTVTESEHSFATAQELDAAITSIQPPAAIDENAQEPQFMELMAEFDPGYKQNSASSTASGSSSGQSTQKSLAKSIVLCSGCGKDTKAEGAKFIQCDMCQRWSHVACIMEQFGLPKSYQKSAWFCAECSPKPLWSDSL